MSDAKLGDIVEYEEVPAGWMVTVLDRPGRKMCRLVARFHFDKDGDPTCSRCVRMLEILGMIYGPQWRCGHCNSGSVRQDRMEIERRAWWAFQQEAA